MAILGVGASLFGAGTFFAGVTDLVVGAALSIGVSYAAQAIQGKPPAPEAARFSLQGQLQADGAVPRSFILGKYATAGSLAYANTWGTSDDGKSPNAYLTQVIPVSDIPVKGLLGELVNGEAVTLDPGAANEKGIPVVEYRKDGADHLWVKFYDGLQTVADPFLVSKVSSAERPYESTRVGVGVAYVIVTALVAEELWTGYPKLKHIIDGARLYDPTRDSTNGGDGLQRFSDYATWGGDGDDLPIVQTYNVLRGIRFNGMWMVGLQKASQATLPTINWNAQIAKCRTPITGPDGDEPTYLSGLQVAVNVPAGQILNPLMTACQGKVTEVGGFYKVYCGAPDSPSFEFTDDDLISSEPQTYNPFRTLADSINGITGTYPDPSQGWNTATAPALYSPENEARDGSRRLLATPPFDAVYRAAQVQRLMQSALLAARRERRHVAVFPARYWFIEPGDVGKWNSVRNGYVNKLFEITATVDKPNVCTGTSLAEVDPADYGWNHSTDYRPSTGGPITFVRPAAQGVIDWNVEGAIVYDDDGLPRRPCAHLSWDGDIPGVIGIRWRIRLKSDQSPVTADNFSIPGEHEINISQSMLPLTIYEMSVQYIPSAPRDMLWSDWRTFTTPDVKLSAVDFVEVLNKKISDGYAQLNGILKDAQDYIERLVTDEAAQTWIDRNSDQSVLAVSNGRLSASISEVRTVALSTTEALAAYQLTVATQFNTTNSNIANEIVARSGADTALAASVSTVSTTVGTHTASLQLLASSVNGNAVNLGIVGTIDSVSGGLIIQGFKSGNVVTYNILIDGNLIVPKSVKAGSIDVAYLTAISAAFGDATVSGTLAGATGRLSLSFTNDQIIISDAS